MAEKWVRAGLFIIKNQNQNQPTKLQKPAPDQHKNDTEQFNFWYIF